MRVLVVLMTALVLIQASVSPGWAGPLDDAAELERQANEHVEAKRPAEGEQLLRRALAIRERVLGPDDPALAYTLLRISLVIDKDKRVAERERLLRRVEAILTRNPGANDSYLALAILLRSQGLSDRGREREAASLAWRALSVEEKASGKDSPDILVHLNHLALLLGNAARYGEAEPLLRRALRIIDSNAGLTERAPVQTLRFLDRLAISLMEQRRHSEAIPVLQPAVVLAEAAGENSPWWGQRVLNRLAGAYLEMGQFHEARKAQASAIDIARRKYAGDSVIVGRLHRQAGRIALKSGDMDAAKMHLARALAILLKRFGEEHLEVIEVRVLQGSMLARLNKKQMPSRFVAPKTFEVLKKYANRAAGARTAADRSARRKVRQLSTMIVEMFAGRGHLGFFDVFLFDIAQLAHVATSGDAITRMAARFGSGGGRLAELVRMRQVAIQQWKKLERALTDGAGQENDAGAGPGAQTRTRLSALSRQIAEIERTLSTDFPEYAEMADLRFIDWNEVALKKNEVMLFYVIGEENSAVWQFADRGLARRLIPIGREELSDDIALLRTGLDASAAQTVGDLPSFDMALAHKLYQKLIAPIDPYIFKDKRFDHLIVVPDGPLASLPFGLLVAKPPVRTAPDFDAYRQAPWLANRFAITVVPSIPALNALRRVAKPSAAKKPFLGIGDPLLRDHPRGTQGERQEVAPLRSAQSKLRAWSRGVKGRIDVAKLFRGGDLADVNAVRDLASLPDTAVELEALAKALGAGADGLLLRERAREPVVRKDTPISEYRILAFATHGLMAGDLEGAAEPALVLTPPDKATPGDDGLLTASEISELSLDADWVILSACNTAASDGTPGAQGLSGLAKAFFHAGSRSLLVSHWPVFSDAAVRLTTGMLQRLAADPALARSDALRRSELALMRDPERPYYAHPIFWAPFTVIGEGGAIGGPVK